MTTITPHEGAPGREPRQPTLAFTVHAHWDDATCTWATDGEDIPGLVCETPTLEELVEVILDAAPDLLRDNLGVAEGAEVRITVVAERQACIAA